MKTFSSVVIERNVTLYGKVNDYLLDQCMTINTNQSIYKGTEFPNKVAFQNIVTDSVNGINLSQQAVINSTNNVVVRGRKTFIRDLKVSSISLKGGKVIDSFDPSAEVFQILKISDADESNSVSFESVNVGNIYAMDLDIHVNYFPQLKKFDDVWLRSTEQVIIL